MERLLLRLKDQYFDHLMQKDKGKMIREWQRMRWLDSITDSMEMNLSKNWETVKNREVCHAADHRVPKELDLT